MINKKQKGFVLIEAIIAVGVLATIFSAAMSLYMSSITGVRVSTDKTIAMYLAQDAMEFVIARYQYNVENKQHGDPRDEWLDGISNCNTCGVDTTVDDVSTYDFSNSEEGLVLSGVNYVPGAGGVFSRSVSVSEINPDHEASVVVTVSWKDGASDEKYILRYNIYSDLVE